MNSETLTLESVVTEFAHCTNLRELIETAARCFDRHSLFYGHGTDCAIDEAAYLAFRVLGLTDVDEDDVDRSLSDDQTRSVIELFARRIIERRPAAYLLNEAWFAGHSFYVDERVLVPRSPIAEWLTRGFAPWVVHNSVRRILDIGTGSGCIAIAAARIFRHASVVAIDISEAALEVADINVERHGVGDRVRTLHSDLFAAVDGQFDLILANPPYVDAHELQAMPAEYRHEPELALTAGEDGLLYAHKIIQQAATYLTPHGALVLEVGASACALLASYPTLEAVELDLAAGGEGLFLIEARRLPQ